MWLCHGDCFYARACHPRGRKGVFEESLPVLAWVYLYDLKFVSPAKSCLEVQCEMARLFARKGDRMRGSGNVSSS